MVWHHNYKRILVHDLMDSICFSRTIEDVMGMMIENEDGKNEFPRDMTLEDCFAPVGNQLYGFVTNVTIPEDILEPCILNVECFENGTRINNNPIKEDEIVTNTPQRDLDLDNAASFTKRKGI